MVLRARLVFLGSGRRRIRALGVGVSVLALMVVAFLRAGVSALASMVVAVLRAGVSVLASMVAALLAVSGS